MIACGVAQVLERSEGQLFDVLEAHLRSCQICQPDGEYSFSCPMGELIRYAWHDAHQLLRHPSSWAVARSTRPESKPREIGIAS